MKKHMHRAHVTATRPYSGPVKWKANPAAHGNVVEIATCRCGAERRTNINQQHVERGPWMMPCPACYGDGNTSTYDGSGSHMCRRCLGHGRTQAQEDT